MAKQIKAGREERSSALWGTTKRDGDSKASALWGNGGRGGAVLLALLTAFVIPLGAGASQASSPSTSSSGQGSGSGSKVAISDALLADAKSNPNDRFRVIVQGASNHDASDVAKDVAEIAAQSNPKLAEAAKKAEEAAKRALDEVKRVADRAAKANAEADKAKADAALKAAKALLTGKQGDRDAAKKAADDAAKKAAEATKAAQDLRSARAAAGLADDSSDEAHDNVSDAADTILEQQITDRFDSISGIAADLTGAQVAGLAANGNQLTAITPDMPVQSTGPAPPQKWSSTQAWVKASGAEPGWGKEKDPAIQSRMPAIAIVDSGIESREDFGDRLIASVNLSSLPNNSPGDGRGHGTFVASIAAGSTDKVTGTAPAAKLVSIDVLDDNGMGMTSDVIRAAQWILDNKAKYNIRVANFSLNSQIEAPFYIDPLDQAVEQLWFNGVVVVAAAGNYGTDGSETGVRYSPANDPFVITVGAADLGTKPDAKDDSIAPWSAWGKTMDGFMKPEISAPGRYMIAAVPPSATLVSERPASVTTRGYMQLSGTSFAAPVVSGAAAVILAKNPSFTPDQVKGALMLTAQSMGKSVGFAGGVGEVHVDKSLEAKDPPNPNAALRAFVGKVNGSGNGLLFDSASWNKVAQSNASWNSASWNSASWHNASWNSASWNSASWNSASWSSASWNSASWNSASWNSASWHKVAQGSASWNSASWNSASWNSASRENAVDLDGPR